MVLENQIAKWTFSKIMLLLSYLAHDFKKSIFCILCDLSKGYLGIGSNISCDCDTIECMSANFGKFNYSSTFFTPCKMLERQIRKLTQDVAEHTLPTEN